MAYVPNSGSVVAFQLDPTKLVGTVSVVGVLPVVQSGTNITSIVSTIPSSVLVGASIFGTVPVTQSGAWTSSVVGSVTAYQGNVPWIVNSQNSSVIAINAGSVVTISQGSVIAVFQSSSIIAINAGSVIAIPSGSVIGVFDKSPSIVGTYSEDAAHTTGDKGLFVLGVRNDLMSSVTGADGEYSPMAQGPVGETLVANSPITKWISAQTSVMYGVSVQAIAAQGASVFTYVTSAQIVNMSGTISLVKFTGGLGSTLGYTVAPASGGSNIVFANALKTGENSGVSASISGVSSVYVSLQGFTSKT